MVNIKKQLESKKTIDNLFKINHDICFILGCSQSLIESIIDILCSSNSKNEGKLKFWNNSKMILLIMWILVLKK